MPLYGSQNYVPSVSLGQAQAVWSAEVVTTGQKSISVSPVQRPGEGTEYVSIEISFNQAPGVFSIQIQTSDTDADAFYNSEAFGGANPGVINAVNAGNTARVELLIKAKFIRLLMAAQPANGGTTVTAKISR